MRLKDEDETMDNMNDDDGGDEASGPKTTDDRLLAIESKLDVLTAQLMPEDINDPPNTDVPEEKPVDTSDLESKYSQLLAKK